MSHDVTIIGAGPAGAAAAVLLASRGLKPVILEQTPKPAKKSHHPEWITIAGIRQLKNCGIDCSSILGEPFTGLTFHSADLKKTAATTAAAPPAYRLDYAQLTDLMHQAVRDAGGQIMYDAIPNRIDPGEKCVRLGLEGHDPMDSAFLLLADGAARTFATVGPGQPPPVVAPPSPQTAGRWFAAVELGSAGRGRESKVADANMHWLVGLDRLQGCMLWWWNGPTVVISMLATGAASAVANALCSNVNRLAQAGAIGHREPIAPTAVAVRPAPRHSALEIESHVEKRLLLIGDAGGFVGETSGEGIYPAVWSAQLAVDTITAALTSKHPQDQLREFSTTWRSTMAEFLRPPNTDVHFLLPLIFSNKQMADRMAGAFWEGTNI